MAYEGIVAVSEEFSENVTQLFVPENDEVVQMEVEAEQDKFLGDNVHEELDYEQEEASSDEEDEEMEFSTNNNACMLEDEENAEINEESAN